MGDTHDALAQRPWEVFRLSCDREITSSDEGCAGEISVEDLNGDVHSSENKQRIRRDRETLKRGEGQAEGLSRRAGESGKKEWGDGGGQSAG